jgi:hypothetical protein
LPAHWESREAPPLIAVGKLSKVELKPEAREKMECASSNILMGSNANA